MAFVSLVSQRRVLPTVGGVSLTDVPHVPRARETLKASRPGKLAKLGVVLVFAGVSSNKNRWRRMQRWRIKANATKRLASLPPLPEERELELKKNIRKAKMVKRRPADQKPWRFAARGGRWQEAIGLLRNSVIPVEAKDYHFLITACVKAGAWNQAVQLLQEMTPLQFRPDAPCFSSLIHAVEHLDDPKEALKNVIDMAPELDAKGFAAVLAACQRLDMVEGLDFLKTVLDQQMPLSEASYIHGINLCARYGEWELSLAVLHEVIELGIVREVDWKMLGEARRACLQAGQWQRVLELSERGSRGSEDAYSYAAQMIALGRLSQLQKAYDLFKEMVEGNVTPNQHVYAALMVDTDDQSWLRALQLLEDSERRGVAANDVMFGKAINCCATAAQWETALCLLQNMDATCGISGVALASAVTACGEGLKLQRAIKLVETPPTSVEPDAELWNAAICACPGNSRLASKLLKSMKAKKLKPSVECYNSALNALRQDEESSSQNSVKRLLHLMQKDGLQPNTVTLNAALGVYVEQGQWQEALAFASQLCKDSIAPSEVTYGTLISTCKESRQWEVALTLLEASLAEASTSVTTFNIAMSVCCGKLDLVIHLLRRMLELDLKPDVYSYNAVLTACQDAGDWQMAVAIFQEMKEQSIVPDIYSYGSVILCCSTAMQWEWAVNLWHQMESQGLPANGIIMNSVAGVCSRCGQQVWADYLLAEMRQRGILLENTAFSASFEPGDGHGVTMEEEQEEEQEEEIEEEEEKEKLSGKALKVFMEKVEGASKLYFEALKDGAFTPWVRPGRLLDLHNMSTEVAKVAVYVALTGVPDLKEDDRAFVLGLKIIVGKGIHSKKNEVVLEPAVRELIEDVFRLDLGKTVEGCFRIPAQDLWAIRCQGAWPPKWLKEGKEPPKAWLRRRKNLPELPKSLQEFRTRFGNHRRRKY